MMLTKYPTVGKETKIELSSLPTKEDLTAWVDSLNGSTLDKIYPSIQRLLKAADKEDSSEAYRQILYRMLSVVYLVYHSKCFIYWAISGVCRIV